MAKSLVRQVFTFIIIFLGCWLVSQVQAKDTRIESQGIEFETYAPTPKQAQFHMSEATFKCLLGAVGCGKSLALCEEAYQLSLAFPGNVGLICRKDYTTLKDSTMKTFFEMIPKGSPLIAKWNETTHDLELKTNGRTSLIMFRGADEYQKFGSYELGWFAMDQAEEMKEEIFRILQQRLRRPNVRHCGIVSANPPNQYHWLYKIFKKEVPDPKDYFLIQFSTYDNKENLPPGYIERLEQMPENWKKMYLYGEFGFMAEGDPVYADFREDIHVAKEPLEAIKGIPIVRSIDPGYLFPACGWYQYVGGKDRVHKLAEFMNPNTTADAFADYILNFERIRFPGWHPIRDFENVGDPHFLDQRTDKSEETSRQIFASKGIKPIKTRASFIKDGINLIRRELLVRDDGKPGYIIDPSCQLTRETYLGGYYLKKESDVPDDTCHPYCDIADTDRYYFVNKVQIVQPEYLAQRQAHEEPEPARDGVTGY
jgi:hypothetical protein